ncbi:MAG: putative LPS assembly protein LptD [Bacteroidota bacterium]
MLCGLALWCCPALALAQVGPDSTRLASPDTLLVPQADSLALNAPVDSLAGLPAPLRQQRAAAPSKLDGPVQFSAQDTLLLLFNRPEGDIGTLIGETEVAYDEVNLSAYAVDILFDQSELRARGMPVDTGMVGRPQFQQAEQNFSGNTLAFNLETQRGRVVTASTRFDGVGGGGGGPAGGGLDPGFLRAGIVKTGEDSTIYVRNGLYTTCDCGPNETPSYSLRSPKMKVQGQWIYTGPLQLYLYNIPTPVWLPFGVLPAISGRRSGPLAPTYGQENQRGFYLRDFGWYFAMNDYRDLELRGGLYSSGSWDGSARYRYNRRYQLRGDLFVSYGRQRLGERTDPDFGISQTSSIQWNHTQEVNPSTSLSGRVNLSSNSYLRNVSTALEDNVRQSVQSSIQYNTRWSNVGRNLRFSASHNQNFANGLTTIQLPNLTFSQAALKPFQRGRSSANEAWYEKINVSYSGSVNNQYQFRPLSEDVLLAQGDTSAASISWFDALLSPTDYRRATGGGEAFTFTARHSIPISAPFSVTRLPLLGPMRLNITPNARYSESWFIRTQRQNLVAVTDSTFTLERTNVNEFFALRQYNLSVSANTNIYGLFPLRIGSYRGLRHTLRPSLSFNYRPDFSAERWGYTRTYRDQNAQEVRYPIVSGVPSGLQQSLGLSLNNVFEMKDVRVDSTGEERSRVVKLLNLDANTSYNFAADSLKLSTISTSARTTLFGDVNVNARASFSPYRTDSTGVTINRYAFDARRLRLARLTTLGLTVATSFRSSSQRGPSRPYDDQRSRGLAGQPGFAGDVNQGIGAGVLDPNDPYNPYDPFTGVYQDGLVDFAIPWSLTLDYSYNVSRTGLTTRFTHTVGARFDFSLTPSLKVQGRSGYDFIRKEMSATSLSMFKEFDCWQMRFEWRPFGTFQSYSFDLQVKSSQLADLLRIRRPRQDVRSRF